MPNGVIFLDIDGVICTDRAWYATEQDKHRQIIRAWDPFAIRLIGRLAADFDYEVVISSTWRKMFDVPLILLTHGFQGSFHRDESTPYLFGSQPRGDEIREWLKEHKDVRNYLIIDDFESGTGIKGTALEKSWIETDYYNGFTVQNFKNARNLLRERHGKLD